MFRILGLLIVTVVAATFDWMMFGSLVLNWQTRDFIPAPARVLSSAMTEKQEEDSDGSYTMYGFALSYEYSFGGRTFMGDTYEAGSPEGTTWESLAKEVVTRFPPGKAVTAYVDPRDPRRAVLRTGVHGRDILFTIPAIWLTLVALSSFWDVMVHFRRPPGATDTAPPAIATAGPIGIPAVAGMFAIFGIFGTDPSMTVALGAPAALLAVAVVVRKWISRRPKRLEKPKHPSLTSSET